MKGIRMLKEHLINLYYNISIKVKLLIVVIILIVYPIVILGYMGYQKYSDVMKDNAISYARKDADDLSTLLSDRIEKVTNFSMQILYDDMLQNTNNKIKDMVDAPEPIKEQILAREFTTYLQAMLYSRPELDTVFFRFTANGMIFDRNKNLVSTPNPSSIVGTAYTHAQPAQGKPVWFLEKSNQEVNGIYLSRVVYDRSTLDEIGVFVFKVNESYFFDIFEKFLKDKNGNLNIYSSDNIELFGFTSFENPDKSIIYELLNSDLSGSIKEKEVKLENDNIYLMYKTIDPLGWKLVVSISSNIFLKDIRAVLKTIVLLCLITLPVWMLLMNFLYLDVIKPMGVLILNMRKIEEGDMGVRVESERNDELGYVFKTFNAMSQEINNLINSMYKEQLAMKEAEIKALQAQINPHFLYNTLETINWKARLYGVEEISDMVMAFSSIIEANLNRKNEKIIPLYKEIEYIDNYNLLIQMRFGKKIKFAKHISEKSLNYEIPKLLVQPLIENAIYHGLETKRGGGTIELIVTIEEETLLIIVSDDGVGIEDEKLKKINQALSETKTSRAVDNSKIGIMNVHRRIRLLYGEEYGVKIFSEVGLGTTIIINLPFREHKGEEFDV